MRFDSPVQATGRRATTEVGIVGCRVAAGDFLTPVIGTASRHPAQFASPDDLDIGRREYRHLAFALGLRFCLGAPLGPPRGTDRDRERRAHFQPHRARWISTAARALLSAGLESLPAAVQAG